MPVMAIYKYFAGKDRFVLPTIHTCTEIHLSQSVRLTRLMTVGSRFLTLQTNANSHQVGITYQKSDLR